MFELKPISHESVPGALAKAERYRLLNEPGQAESICRDVLGVEPGNQQALIHLTLALTEQQAFSRALETAATLESAYDRAYYTGIVWERRAKARHHESAYDWLVKALRCYDEAERLRAPGNDDALLRWNTCVRYLAQHKELAPRVVEEPEPIISE